MEEFDKGWQCNPRWGDAGLFKEGKGVARGAFLTFGGIECCGSKQLIQVHNSRVFQSDVRTLMSRS